MELEQEQQRKRPAAAEKASPRPGGTPEAVDQAMDVMFQEVVANISHDLKTPLTAIRGYAQGILDGVASTPDRLNKYIVTIRNKANDMANLVDELSFFSQICQGSLQYHWVYVNAVDYVSGCVSEVSLDLEMRKISLLFHSNVSPDCRICIDTEKMKRVINNIIGNASKYIDTDMGVIYVNMEDSEENLIIHITDNGVGIAKEELPLIFDRFYRTDSSRNSNTGGSGLGLSIASKIMEDHGGAIQAESEKGIGTRISLFIPKEQKKEATA